MKKQISMEDMAELICSYYCDKGYCPCDCKNCDNHKFAEEIIKGCRKIPENAVVLTREEYELITDIKALKLQVQDSLNNMNNDDIANITKQVFNETAREILKEIDNALHDLAIQYSNSGHITYFAVCENVHHTVVSKVAKQYGFDM